jgi:CubicO group peptidase (beta-lactamase class C family)
MCKTPAERMFETRFSWAMIDFPLGRQMRRSLLLVLAIAAVLFGHVPARADDLVLERFSDYLEALRSQAGIPGLAAVIVGSSDITWERAFGKQDLERSIATRTDTPFHVDGLTQMFTASLIMRCVEEGKLSLDDRVGQFVTGASEPNATLRQLLMHTSDGGGFQYRPERLDPLASVIKDCNAETFRAKLAKGFDWLAMKDSVPGPDVVHMTPTADDVFTSSTLEHYAKVVDRLATPYVVDSRGRASASRYAAATLTPSSGAISTARDLGQFVLGIRKGVIVRPETLALAWKPPIDAAGHRLPHGLGWFVQSYNGETIVWQFGVSDNGSSSLLITVPGRDISLVLLANSDGLVRPFPLAAGDLASSPFGKLFLGVFVR